MPIRFAPFIVLVVAGFASSLIAADAEPAGKSHARQRPELPASSRPLDEGPAKFVDAAQGDDAADGSERKPWRTLQHACRQLRPGDTLYVRGGTYYEHLALTQSGTAEKPITIRGCPGETATLDGGLREFHDDPAGSWQPYDEGAPGEYVSTKTYPEFSDERTPYEFVPGEWKPLWGIEIERPLALGNFADSMVPLHGYRYRNDMRATNEYWTTDDKHADFGVYSGPGLWFNRDTGRVHIRLAHHTMPGLGERAYRGETDPRRLRLVVALGFGQDVLQMKGLRHVRVQDLTVRGATGSTLVHLYGSQDVEFDRLQAYGGFPALLVNASQNIRVVQSAFRGLAAPWTGRAHMKYRGTASYQIVLQNHQPLNENIEFAHCEFTDDHDFAYVRYVKNLQFHHNYVDNFNDDGFECGPKLRDHTMYIYQNHIGPCLGTFTQHDVDKDRPPVDHDPKSGAFIFRNVVDQRAGVFYHLPREADPTGAFLHAEGALGNDHGGPIWAVMRLYHNTVLRRGPVQRDNYLFGMAVRGMRHTERDIFNNIFVQHDTMPGVKFVAMKQAENLRAGGNLLWGFAGSAESAEDPFAVFRASPLFQESMKFYAAGWTTHDRFAEPMFVGSVEENHPIDVRLQKNSPAVDAGLIVPAEWPDPLRDADAGKPDIGALPLGAALERVGIDGRYSIIGGRNGGE